jgi:hypothetical protein
MSVRRCVCVFVCACVSVSVSVCAGFRRGGGGQANIPRPLILEAELLLDFTDDPDFGEQLLEVVLRHLVTNTACASRILRFASR